MLLGITEFFVTLILFRYLLIYSNNKKETSSNRNLIVGFISILLFVVIGATLVKTFRGTTESFKGASSQLNETKSNAFISPSLYLYLSSNIGVLNKFLLEGTEEASIGENTFTPVYNFLSKFGLTKRVSFNERGYFIPMWSNSATYLRELYADYGTLGIFLIPYLLGLITTFYWIKLYSTLSLKYFPILVYLFSIVSLSWFSSMTKGGNWLISLLILVLMTPMIETIILGKKTIRNF
jgi:oligosaccharide repeat unit polymerase